MKDRKDLPIYLPPGIELTEEDEKPKSEEYQNSIRYPNKQFYAEYYAICDRLDKFVNEISVAMITDFVNRNRHILDKEWVKPKQAKNT